MKHSSCFGLDTQTLHTILANFPLELVVTDLEGSILYVNHAFCTFYNKPSSLFLGRNLNDLEGEPWSKRDDSVTVIHKDTNVEVLTYATGSTPIYIMKRILKKKNTPEYAVIVKQRTALQADIPIGNTVDTTKKFVIRQENSNMPVIISRSVAMDEVLRLSQICAQSDMSILITGESGTGKTNLAKYIHVHSQRKNHHFLALNCGAIAKELMESELFGYEPHSFTGASKKGKIGLVELADGGTLFLDEIGDMPLDIQAKILHFVENQTFLSVGGRIPKKSNVRILAATHKNLWDMVANNTFREDLYWRLNAFELQIPPLRNRPDDILPLANYFLNISNKKYGKNKRFAPNVHQCFVGYSWPGNIRQIKHIVERSFLVADEFQISKTHLPEELTQNLVVEEMITFQEQFEEKESTFIKVAYEKYPSSRKLADALHISQSTANRLIQKYIQEPKL